MFSSILLPPPPTSTLFPYTTLFRSDAILSADSTLEALRREQGDRYRYGIVVLSDGADTSSRTSLAQLEDRKSTRLNSSHITISYAVFCLKKKKKKINNKLETKQAAL